MKNNLAFNYYEVYNWLEINYKPYSEGPIVLKPFQPSMHFNGMCEVPPLYKETSAQKRNVAYICWDDDGYDELIRNKENKTSIRRIINFGILIDRDPLFISLTTQCTILSVTLVLNIFDWFLFV